MNQLRKTNGITLMSLVITIVVMLIVASIVAATIIGQGETIDTANDAKIYTELKQLQEEIEKYKVERVSNKNIRKGDFSGKVSNEDLVTDGILNQYLGIRINKEDIVRANEKDKGKTNVKLGVIDVRKLATENKTDIDSQLGKGSSNNYDGNDNLTQFTDVFAIDINDNTLYYANDGKVWKLGNDHIDIPKISVTPTSGEINKNTKFSINVQGENLAEENEYKYYFSTDETSLIGGLENDYTSGTKFTFDGNKDNTYYLFVKEIKDVSENVSEKYGEKIEISGTNYHRFGPYIFAEADDNDIEFTYTYEDGELINDFNPNNWFNENIKVEVTWGTSLTNRKIQSNSDNCQISSSSIIAKDSQKITATATGTSGNVEKEINLKIDKNPPVVAISKNTGDKSLVNGTATIRTNINITDSESGVNYGVTQYGWSDGEKDEDEPTNWTNIDSQSTNIEYTVSDNNNHYLWVKTTDIAGNETVEKEMFKMAEAIAKVIIGTEETVYFSLQEAFDACPKDGTSATVELLKDIDEVSSTYVGQNILLNLAGHTIESTDANRATISNNANLQIVQFIGTTEQIESDENKAKIISRNFVAIENKTNSSLTLGDDDDLVFSGPNFDSLIISGKQIGIKNNGNFNFYDGNITAISAFEGNALEIGKPTDYSLITTKNGEDEIAYLGILSNYAARIKNVYYSTLQDAVDNARVGDTIILVSPNVLTDTLTIDKTKDITIDMNKLKISSNITTGYIIDNKGKLRITTSDSETPGEIISVNRDILYNDEEAQLIIENTVLTLNIAGTKTMDKNVIYNLGTVNVKEGTLINANQNYNNGIYNIGTLNNYGGTIYGKQYSIINEGNFINYSGSATSALKNNEGGNIRLVSGTLSQNNLYGGTLQVEGGKIDGGDTGINIRENNPTINILGGEVKVIYLASSSKNEYTNINIDGGKVTSSRYNAITAYTSGKYVVNVKDGECNSIYTSGNVTESKIYIYGGTVGNISQEPKSGELKITGGNLTNGITAKNVSVTLGENDGTIYSAVPEIRGGIQLTQTPIYFYDGIVIASSSNNKAINGEITEIAPNAELIYGKDNNK